MKPHELDWYDIFARVCDFGNAHAALFPTPSLAREQFAAVASAMQQLRPYATRHGRLTEGGTRRAVVHDALRRRLIAINRTARMLDELSHGLARRFPHPASRRSDMLVTAARAYARAAKAYEAVFIAHGMPVTFIADLIEFAERINETSRNHAAEKAERAHAQVTIRAAFTSGMAAARTLDVIMANRLVDDPPMLAAWQRARRLRTRPGLPRQLQNFTEKYSPALETRGQPASEDTTRAYKEGSV